MITSHYDVLLVRGLFCPKYSGTKPFLLTEFNHPLVELWTSIRV